MWSNMHEISSRLKFAKWRWLSLAVSNSSIIFILHSWPVFTSQNLSEPRSFVCILVMSSFSTNRMMRRRFDPVVLLQSLLMVRKRVFTGSFSDFSNAFANLRNRFSKENFKCVTSLIGSIKYMCVPR